VKSTFPPGPANSSSRRAGTRSLSLAWLDGYYRAEDDPPIVDTNQLDANAKKLNAYCAAHPDTKLITAADSLFERE
jgi:acid stress chaperone HdeB